MYVQQHFSENNTATLHELMRRHPLGSFVVMTPGGLEVNHIPFFLDATRAPHGVLRAHLPIGNSLWQQEPARAPEAVVIFQGEESYITPSWYPTKHEHGKAVPTWNYVVVHAYGTPRFVRDRHWLLAHVTELTNEHEAAQPSPWQVSDAPGDYIDSMLNRIVGVEIPITRMLGKWKVSQNRPMSDRQGVAAGLDSQQNVRAAAMGALVKQHL